MAKVSTKESTTKTTLSESFNIKAESDGYTVDVEYKPGFMNRYDDLFSIDTKMIPQLIEVLQAMQEALSETSGD